MLAFVISASLFLAACGKKVADAAEPQKESPPNKIAEKEPAVATLPPSVVAATILAKNDQSVAPAEVLSKTDNPQSDEARQQRKAAIFVLSRDKKLEDKISSMEDYVTSQVSGRFSLISREVVVNALKPGELESKLSEGSSALRLAQSLGADYLFVVTLNSLASDSRNSAELGTANTFNTLKATYKVIDGGHGGTLAGGTGTVTTKKVSRSAENSGVIDDLLDEASVEIAKRMDTAVIAAASSRLADVEVTIICGMTDLVDRPISIPDLRVNEQGVVVVGEQKLEVQSLNVDVAINGMARGSAPGKFKMPRGLNKLRLHREGFIDREMDVNFSDGTTYKTALQMSEAGYKRWQETTTFLFAIKSGEKLTDGTVKMMEGFAQTLRQSGYRVDTKTDVKVDAKGKSLFDGASLKVFGK